MKGWPQPPRVPHSAFPQHTFRAPRQSLGSTALSLPDPSGSCMGGWFSLAVQTPSFQGPRPGLLTSPCASNSAERYIPVWLSKDMAMTLLA